jgi:hypothetical protein
LDPWHCEAGKPRIWVGTDSSWQDKEVTTSPQTVVSIDIKKKKNNSLLKISFFGGRLSFTANTYNPQALFSIKIDDVVIAESLSFDSVLGFRNTYPYIATVVNNAKKGEHTIAVTVEKTDNDDPDEGILTYTTTIGASPNTYRAYLTVEEWPKGIMNE